MSQKDVTDMHGISNKVWYVARAISGIPKDEDFRLEQEPVPEPGEGQVLMRTIYLGIAPGVRPMLPYASAESDTDFNPSSGRADTSEDRLNDPTFIQVGDRMRSGYVGSPFFQTSGGVGQVIKSNHPGFKEGDYILGARHWQEYEVVDGDVSLRLDPTEIPIEAYLSMTGLSSFAAWVGYRRLCDAKAGETLVVSSAAGTVSTLVIQLAKADGLRVIGISSGKGKCAFVTDRLVANACIDRSAEDIGKALDRLAPGGVDIYYDNVGGLMQKTVFDRLKPFARLIVCGLSAEYNGLETSVIPSGMVLGKRLRVQGFVVLDYMKDYDAFYADIVNLRRAGKLVYDQQIYQGIEQAPRALHDCLSGNNQGGKIIVQVSADTIK